MIGYVSAVRMPTAVTESLGMAELDGRHFVLRSMVWVEEFDELERALDLLSFDERSALERERRVHREAAIFLHEWGHLMGAGHESLSASIMADLYHPQAVAVSPESSRIIQSTLRAGPRRAAAAEAPAPEPPGSPPTVTPREAGPGPAPRGPRAPLPAHLQPLPTAASLPASRTAAAVMGAKGSSDRLTALAAREVSLQASGAGPTDWLQLARQASRLKAPALAERAARRAGAAPGAAFLAEDSQRQRREVALPLDGSIVPEREPAYLDGVNGVLDHVAEERLPKAREALRQLGGAFPGSPGLALATCSVVEAERQAAATAACTSAVQAFDESPRSHLLLGAVHGRANRWTEARDQFLKAMALDDATGEVWARLSGALGHLGDTAAQRELADRYRAKFGLALRPARD